MIRSQLPSATLNWYDLDHPMPDGDTSPAELDAQADRHERNRLEAVAETIGIVGIMTARGLLTGGEIVTVGGAIYQFGKGAREQQVVAAHCLPGQLAFNGQPLHTSTDWSPALLASCGLKPLPLAAKLRNLSGLTDYVAAIVNQADSLVEIMPGGGGLKPSFGIAVGRLMRDLAAGRPRDWQSVSTLVIHALEHYRLNASNACKTRLDQLDPLVPGPAPDSAEALKSRIIRRYQATVCNSAIAPMTTAVFLRLVEELVTPENGNLPPPAC